MSISVKLSLEGKELFADVRIERQAIKIPKAGAITVGFRRVDLIFIFQGSELVDKTVTSGNGPLSTERGYDIYVDPDTERNVAYALRFVTLGRASCLSLAERLRIGVVRVETDPGAEVEAAFVLPTGSNDLIIDSYGSLREFVESLPREKQLVLEKLMCQQVVMTLMESQRYLARSMITVPLS